MNFSEIFFFRNFLQNICSNFLDKAAFQFRFPLTFFLMKRNYTMNDNLAEAVLAQFSCYVPPQIKQTNYVDTFGMACFVGITIFLFSTIPILALLRRGFWGDLVFALYALLIWPRMPSDFHEYLYPFLLFPPVLLSSTAVAYLLSCSIDKLATIRGLKDQNVVGK